jgi:hypothetical protein
MAFMRAYVSDHTHRFLVADTIDEPVMCGPNHINLPVGTYDADHTMWLDQALTVHWLLDEYGITEFEIVEKYWGNLSVPGYMDQTDYVLGDTRAEVAAELLNMHFDGDYDLDEEEVVDVAFLESLLEADRDAKAYAGPSPWRDWRSDKEVL